MIRNKSQFGKNLMTLFVLLGSQLVHGVLDILRYLLKDLIMNYGIKDLKIQNGVNGKVLGGPIQVLLVLLHQK